MYKDDDDHDSVDQLGRWETPTLTTLAAEDAELLGNPGNDGIELFS